MKKAKIEQCQKCKSFVNTDLPSYKRLKIITEYENKKKIKFVCTNKNCLYFEEK